MISHMVKKPASMAWHQLRVVGEKYVPCIKIMRLSIVLHARTILGVSCSVFSELVTLVIDGAYCGSGVAEVIERSMVQRPDGARAPSKILFLYCVIRTVVL